jgi:hypothetical protein
MYYKEAWINGKLCCKSTPNGEWIPFTIGQYKEKVKQLEEQVKNLTLAAVIGSLPSDKLYCEGDLFAAYLTGQQDVRDRSDGLDGRTFTAWLAENFPRQ